MKKVVMGAVGVMTAAAMLAMPGVQVDAATSATVKAEIYASNSALYRLIGFFYTEEDEYVQNFALSLSPSKPQMAQIVEVNDGETTSYSESYSFTDTGLLEAVSSPEIDPASRAYAYDEMGRVIASYVDYQAWPTERTMTYTETNGMIRQDMGGNMDSYSVDYSLDKYGRISTINYYIDEEIGTTKLTYKNNRIVKATTGERVANFYTDDAKHITGFSRDLDEGTLTGSYTYDAAGNLTQSRLCVTDPLGTTTYSKETTYIY